MELSFILDPETGEPHIHEHGVTEDEVRQVLARPGEVLDGENNSRLVLGQTESGRYLKIVSTSRRRKPGIFVITAYELRGTELKAYRRRRRKKQ